MAVKTGSFQHRRVVELIMSSPKRIGRGMRNYDSAVGTRRSKPPCYMAPTVKSRRIQHLKITNLALTTSFCLTPALWIQCRASVPGRIIPKPAIHACREEKLTG